MLARMLIAALVATLFVVLPSSAKPAQAFSICGFDTLIPWQQYVVLAECGRHENLSETAVKVGTPLVTSSWTPSDAFLTDLVRGVENTDIEHQWDCDSHFDNSTVKTVTDPIGQAILCTDGKGHAGFDAGFATLRQRLQTALTYAKGNPQFLNPNFIRFSDIVVDIQATLLSLQGDVGCLLALACPQARLIPVQHELLAYMALLGYNANPDPIPTDSPGFSPFTYSPYPTIVQNVLNDLVELLGPHFEAPIFGCGCQKTLAEAIGSDNPLVQQLQHELDEVRAYIAFQNLGHVFHTTEDFFAHSNYTELMASAIGHQTILQNPATVLKISDVTLWPACDPSALPAVGCANLADQFPPIPSTYDGFSLAGMEAMLYQAGAAAGELQSGAVVTSLFGEGNYCGSTFDHFFNPVVGPGIASFTLPATTDDGVEITPPFTFPAMQVNLTLANPAPPPGFDYCHYQTATALGLNKDEPGGESQQVNHAYAFSAAARMAEELWTQFLTELTNITTVTSSPVPTDGTVTTHQTTLTLTASDPTGGGVASITTSASGANPIALTTTPGSTVQLTISNPGDTEVHYYATNNAGNNEPTKTYDARLRTTAANPGYKYLVEATAAAGTATSGFRSLGIGPSINDWGEVAYTGATDSGSGIYIADATGASRPVNPSWATNPSRRFEDIVTLTNGRAVAVGDRVSGSPPSYRIRVWDARPGVIDTYQTIDASSAGTTSAAAVTFDPGYPGVPAAGIVGMMTAQPAGFNLAPGTSTPGNGFDAVVTPTMNNNGVVAWAGLNGNQWQLASSTPFASGVPPQKATSSGQWSGSIRQSVSDDGHIIARASGDAPGPGEPLWAADAPLMMWNTDYTGDQTIVCQLGCTHTGFSAIGRFAGASGDSAVIAFAANGPQGPGIYASVRAQITQSTEDGRVVVPIVLTSGDSPVKQIEGAFRIAVNSTQKSGERAVEIAFMADNATGDKGIWVSRLHFVGNSDGTYDSANPTALCASVVSAQCAAEPPQMVVQQGAAIPSLPGTVSDVWYYDPINNRNSGDLAFWVSMTTGAQAIIRARPLCGSTDYAPGTEMTSQYINQYDAGKTLNMLTAYGVRKGDNACGPSSLAMAINNILRAQGKATPDGMANLKNLFGDGTTNPDGTPNGVMIQQEGKQPPIQNLDHPLYSQARAIALLSSMLWMHVQPLNGSQAQLDVALEAGKQVVESTKFGTAGQAYSSGGMTGSLGSGHLILFSGRTPMGDYIVEDPAGDFFSNPTSSLPGAHYGPGICGKYVVYPKSTVVANIKYGLAISYDPANVDPNVLLIQAFPNGTTTGRQFNMWVTDSSGRQAGFPNGGTTSLSDIPDSFASIDPLSIGSPEATPSEEVPESSFPYAVIIVNPPSGLQVHVQAPTTDASYLLEYTQFSGGVATSSDQLTDTVVAGGTKVVPVVHSPRATAQTVIARQETPRAIQLAGTDPASLPLTFAIATPPANGTLSAVTTGGTYLYTPATGYTGSDSFMFTVSNGVITSKPATVAITVNPNTSPVAVDSTTATDENVPLQIALTGSAPSGQPITFAAGQPFNGAVTLSGSTATYTPTKYFNGADSFTFTVNDGFLTSTAATITITVRHVFQPPVVTITAPSSVNEGATPAPITATVTYPDGDPASLGWVTSAGNLISNGTSATFNADDGPATATISLTATTSHGLTTISTATIQVLNVPPTVSVGTAQTQSWGLPVTLTGNATDPSTADTAAGLNPTWSFGDTTANAPGYSLTHTYANPGTYAAKLTATDKDGGVGSATVAVTVNKRGSTLAYTGSTTAPYGFVTLSAKLTDSVDIPSARLAGHKVTFLVGTQAFATVTDATGTATVVPAPIAPGSYSVATVFSADSLYLSSSARATLVVSNSVGSSTGTALVPATGGTASFNVTSTGSTITGTLDYSSGTTVVHATSLAPFGIRPDGHAAWFSGVDTLGRKITVYVEDSGLFKLSINGIAQTGTGALAGGTVQVVKT